MELASDSDSTMTPTNTISASICTYCMIMH